ncbi:pyrroline-5-carboxylate reductase 3 isoform X2 [Aricia agestis]|uniref:pyrroline-5-carboxylate reductase 3 isoform X2 n=1 Tax=Aricia agestis TaxID=91739 RepID=UPI001C20AB3A|nr:pyrroline-5-carboxylate reductase 3 isoform X2 [Aricia agestis]
METMSYKVGFIGGGNMSTAIMRGILRNEAQKPSDIWVSGPRIVNLKHWQDIGANVTTSNREVLLECDVVFLGVKPGMLEAALSDCVINDPRPLVIGTSKILVSMLVGITIERVHQALQSILPPPSCIKVIRIMPNTPMMVGVGSCLYSPDAKATQEDCMLLKALLSKSAVTDQIPETMIDSLGSLTGCGPAFVYIIIEALADGAVKQGVPRAVALRQAAQVVAGSGQMMLQTGKHPAQLKDEGDINKCNRSSHIKDDGDK